MDLGGHDGAELLRQAGCRPSPQRLMVLRALASGAHVSARRILDDVRLMYPTVNPSTIYRTLDALVAAGLVRANDLGLGRTHYELARSHRHHHAVCVACGAISHLHDADLLPLEAALAAATGYRLADDRELTIPGQCPSCQGFDGSDASSQEPHSSSSYTAL